MNLSKEYKLIQCKLLSAGTKKMYKVSIQDDDRFYHYIRPFIIKEKVEGETTFLIDELIVKDCDKTFFEEKQFLFEAILLIEEEKENFVAYSFVFDKAISLDVIGTSKREYKNDIWKLTLHGLKVPYNTNVIITEIQDN